tara:strand:+ start:206 stop:406 length:201 start_codon:yes stop_codon:yes gene_type:complete
MYELDDHLLIRDDKVIAVSANERFTDGDNPIHPQKGDTIAFVTSALGAVAYIGLGVPPALPIEDED